MGYLACPSYLASIFPSLNVSGSSRRRVDARRASTVLMSILDALNLTPRCVLLYGIIRHGDCPRGREPAHLMQPLCLATLLGQCVQGWFGASN